jgi:uroporphyrin-III C-methyltransferase
VPEHPQHNPETTAADEPSDVLASPPAGFGTVHLVGAGPGDVELLTVRATKLLHEADVVVYDALVDQQVLEIISKSARLIDVGKRPGNPFPQEEISALLVALAAEYRCIVRLKGGDPFVFGRGGEEAISLQQAGISCTVVPGVTSAFAAPAIAGIPVTHRGLAAAVTVVTGHRTHGQHPVNWQALATTGATLVVLMGVAERGHIATQLIQGGMDPLTPVAAVSTATTSAESVVRFQLRDLGTTPLRPPATMVIGAVAALETGVRYAHTEPDTSG